MAYGIRLALTLTLQARSFTPSGMVLKDSKLLKTGLPTFKGQGLRRIRGSVLDVGGALPKESRK